MPNPTLQPEQKDEEIIFDKAVRLTIAALIETVKSRPYGSAERTLSFRALQQARHWLGEDLRILGAQCPYPNGNNPLTAQVDPPGDYPTAEQAESLDKVCPHPNGNNPLDAK